MVREVTWAFQTWATHMEVIGAYTVRAGSYYFHVCNLSQGCSSYFHVCNTSTLAPVTHMEVIGATAFIQMIF